MIVDRNMMKHVFHATQQQSVTFGLVHQIKCNPLEKRHFGLYLFLHNCKVDEKMRILVVTNVGCNMRS